MRIISSGAASVFILVALLLNPSTETWGQETPVASTPTIVANLQVDTVNALGLVEGNPSVSWPAVSNAAQYSLSGSMFVIQVNRADPFCTAAVETETQSIEIGETVVAPSTSFEISLPALPASDAWFVSQVSLTLSATDADGSVLGMGGANGTAESTCLRPPSTPTSRPQLPGTGFGESASEGGNAWIVPLVLGLLILLGLGPAAIAYHRR